MNGLIKIAATALLAAIIGPMCPTTSMAQFSRSDQTTACMGDALRLCASEIPSKEKIIACLAAKHAQLSPGCVGVFDANMRALKRGEN